MYLQGNFENNLAEAFNLMNTGKIDKAINLFENLTEKFPNTAKAFHLKAFAYTQDKNFNKALESIEKAKNLSPDNLDINLDYANILSAINKKKEAIKILSYIEKKANRDARIYYNLGCLYIDILNYKELMELYEILEKDDNVIFKWYSDDNYTKEIAENRVSKLLKNFKIN